MCGRNAVLPLYVHLYQHKCRQTTPPPTITAGLAEPADQLPPDAGNNNSSQAHPQMTALCWSQWRPSPEPSRLGMIPEAGLATSLLRVLELHGHKDTTGNKAATASTQHTIQQWPVEQLPAGQPRWSYPPLGPTEAASAVDHHHRVQATLAKQLHR